MKKNLLSFMLLLLFSTYIYGQFPFPKINADDPDLPAWVKLMYSENPNVMEVDRAYEQYYEAHKTEENSYTVYYKHWRRYVEPYTNAKGYVVVPDAKARAKKEAYFKKYASIPSGIHSKISAAPSGIASWTFAGPDQMYNVNASPQIPISEHANVYCLDRAPSNSNILYCGTESGGVYRSINKGLNWTYLTKDLDVEFVKSIRVHPSNPDIVIFSSNSTIYKTTDGGTTWVQYPGAVFGQVREITFLTSNPSIVLVAAETGLYRSADGGTTYSQILTGSCWNAVMKPGTPSTVYVLRYNSTGKVTQFYRSTDSGLTFALQTTGWYVPQAGEDNIGGRMAVTEANPEKIYAVLVGSSTSGAARQLNGYIGVYVSNNGGTSWSLPQNYIGTPYDNTILSNGSCPRPNLMNFSGDNGAYSQILYNTCITASQLDANKVLIGGMSLWRSADGCATYKPVGGYIGSLQNIHPDNQTIKNYKTSATTEEVWLTSDGGINLSTDFFTAINETRTQGLYASDFWGFDAGWNEDVLVGGRYHNGDAVYYQNYPAKKFLAIGGGEQATGYVNPGENRKLYFSDIGGRYAPLQFNDPVTDFPISDYPNESFAGDKSVMAFDPRNYNTILLGKNHQLFKTTNGQLFSVLKTFGTASADKIKWIEISRKNPDLIYLVQSPDGQGGKLWKSTNGGTTWSEVLLPQGAAGRLTFTLSGADENELWIAFESAANGSKVYKSVNGGSSWSNITTAALNDAKVNFITHQLGTNGGVYVGTEKKGIFYRNNLMSDWVNYSNGLPVIINPVRLKPFYRDEKLRCGSRYVAVWETPLYEASLPQAQISVDKNCSLEASPVFKFANYSVYKSGATFLWSFPGGTPSSSTALSPSVTYSSSGSYSVTLKVTNPDGQTSTQTYTGFIKVGMTNCGTLRTPENPATTVNGLDYKYYESDFEAQYPYLGDLTPVKTGTVSNFDISVRNRDDDFAFLFTGYLSVPADGYYNFYLNSDDGSRLYIGNTAVAFSPWGLGPAGSIGLKAGKHAITVGCNEDGGDQRLQVFYDGPGITYQAIPNSVLYRVSEVSNCTAPIWSPTAVYTAGMNASYGGIKYTAAYWTQNQRPDLNYGPQGSGQPWILVGPCTSKTSEASSLSETKDFYPNPTTGVLNITYDAMVQGEVKIVVTNLASRQLLESGKQVFAGENKFTVDLSNLSNGLYIITISDAYTTVIREVVINK